MGVSYRNLLILYDYSVLVPDSECLEELHTAICSPWNFRDMNPTARIM